MSWGFRNDLFATIAASGITSIAYNIEGVWNLTLQTVGSPSTTTVQWSNDSGHDAAITNWQSAMTLSGASLAFLPAGARWIRLQRSETTNAILAGYQRSW